MFKILSDLKTNSSPGPDGIPTILLKNLKNVLSHPLSILFELIFQFVQLPNQWKTAIVKPIFKKGSSSDPNNYRPISLTSVICKVFESIIKKSLLLFFKEHNLVTSHQHGFLSLHSTTTNLLECIKNLTVTLDKSGVVKILYIDLMKAFDVVSVPKLLHKLQNFGVNGLLLSCIASFLSDRSQCFKVGNCLSEPRRLISGVPQGSVLGHFYS
jgi:hypothetical protein